MDAGAGATSINHQGALNERLILAIRLYAFRCRDRGIAGRDAVSLGGLVLEDYAWPESSAELIPSIASTGRESLIADVLLDLHLGKCNVVKDLRLRLDLLILES